MLKADLSSNYHTLSNDLEHLFLTNNMTMICHNNRGKTNRGKTYYYMLDKGKETLELLLKSDL